MTLRTADLVRIRDRDARDQLYVVGKVVADEFTDVEHLTLHPMIPRLFEGRDVVPRLRGGLVAQQVERLSSPAEALEQALSRRSEGWPTRTRQAIERLFAMWLLHEDRRRLLDASAVDQLAHQVSLLEFVKQRDMRRLLIADEVGLGKTIEAGLIIDWLLRTKLGARVLYLAPAMLVDNVFDELRRMELPARVDRYAASVSSISNEHLAEAQVIVASIHKASFDRNFPFWRDESGAWDLIVVDECHHLADWSPDGGKPQQRMRLVRDLVERRLHPEGRLVLMSATPHQGNESKFRNLLRLLSDEGYRDAAGSLESVAGRVIYRTKEDVRAWDGQPLFPKRKVNEPTYVELGPDYAAWLEEVARVFEAAGEGPSGWRKAQALQWAASSPRAGLAYLVRLAMREGWDFDTHPLLERAAEAMLPYRNLPAEAPVEAVRTLLRKQTGVEKSRREPKDDEETEDVIAEEAIDAEALERAIEKGLALALGGAMRRKMSPLLKWVEEEAQSKFVVFATPIETVDELRRGLEETLGAGAVVSITGGLASFERRQRMHEFRGEGVRVLVASRAGSEGINLQVAHRLVHFDVPWNPMELEQRVGRVHRYGSTKTVVVDTLVARDSREERMLRRCRARLAQIVEHLIGPEHREGSRFEEIYGRVMSQIPSDQLAELVADEGFLTSGGERLDQLVQAGFDGWQATDKALRGATRTSVESIPDRGPTRPSDLEKVLELLGAEPEEGWMHVRLVEREGARVEDTQPARVFRFLSEGKGVRRVADGLSSLSLRGPSGFQGHIERAGLNLPTVAAKLRELVGGADPDASRSPRATSFVDGAGTVRLQPDTWSSWRSEAGLDGDLWSEGATLLAWGLRLVNKGTPTEVHSGIRAYLQPPAGDGGRWLTPAETASLVRHLWAERGLQNLVVPPHKRAGSTPFELKTLAERSRDLLRDAVLGAEEFDLHEHEYRIMPLAALTLEPRAADSKAETTAGQEREASEASARESVFIALEGDYQPPGDFLERVFDAVRGVAPRTGDAGDQAVYALLLVDLSRVDSLAAADRALAFAVYVGMTAQDILARFEQHRDPGNFLRAPSLSWERLTPVGVMRLGEPFMDLSPATAAALEGELAEALRRQGLRVLGGH